MATETDLTVAVTGPTGTFGFGLLPLLQQDDRVSRVVGVARRPFDPDEHGWTKMEYRRGDVRNVETLREAFAGADVVVHLAFLIVGGDQATTRGINIQGTLNAFRAAAAAGARRFVYASSVAAYGFHRDNPVGMTEDWPTRPARTLFYAREKAELEQLLADEAAGHPELDVYLLRPPVVLGPHALGAKSLPGLVESAGRWLPDGARRLPFPLPAVVPDLPLQLIHEEDVGRALVQCVVAAGPPGAYNIAADDVLSLVDVARELGLLPLRVPAAPAQVAARLASRLPLLPASAQWVEAASQPAIMATDKAKSDLDWKPRIGALEALRDALEHAGQQVGQQVGRHPARQAGPADRG